MISWMGYNSPMKKLALISAFFILSPMAMASINTDRVTVNLFKIFGFSKLKDGLVHVNGPSIPWSQQEADMFEDGKTYKISPALYKRAQELGVSVFRTSAAMDLHGSSFSIGGNLILTNHHVISPNRDKDVECGSFELKTNDKDYETFKCKEVLFCETDRDFCLVEMKPNKKKIKIDGIKKEVESHLSRIPSLKLDASYALNVGPNYSDKTFTSIGNSKGFGIHYGEGKILLKHQSDYYLYAPVTGGNSGGPLLNDKGHVIGIIKLQSQEFYGEDYTGTIIYNKAVPIKEVVETLRQKLQNRPEVLAKINKALLAP